MRTRLTTALALAVAAFAGAAHAAPSPVGGNFQVTATVIGSCAITATPTLAFGNYDPADVNNTVALTGQSSVSVRCTRGTTATVSLDQGANAASGSTCGAPLRQMASGAERLRYDLYQNAARDEVWGCQTGAGVNTQAFTSTSSTAPTTLQTYGRIAAGQDVPAGSYTDTVEFSVTF